MKTISPEAADLDNYAASLGLTLETSKPIAEIRDNDWPCVSFDVTLKKGETVVHSSRYSMGVGHVPAATKSKDDEIRLSGFGGGSSVFWTIVRNGWQCITKMSHVRDREEGLEMLRVQALRHKVKPTLADVLYSFLMDGQPSFDAYTFEDWASEYGYDTDSRKAESIFEECRKTGDALRRHLSAAEIGKLRELAYEM